MKHKKTITSVALILLGLRGLQAQENSTAAGGQATGTGGTASYSLGQVVYTTATGTNGSISQGVQQTYEISAITGIAETAIKLELSVYPNPTTHFLKLEVGSEDLENLSYQLYDMQGKVIENKKVDSNTTHISLEGQSTGTYFLSVVKDNQIVKTFKVIKN